MTCLKGWRWRVFYHLIFNFLSFISHQVSLCVGSSWERWASRSPRPKRRAGEWGHGSLVKDVLFVSPHTKTHLNMLYFHIFYAAGIPRKDWTPRTFRCGGASGKHESVNPSCAGCFHWYYWASHIVIFFSGQIRRARPTRGQRSPRSTRCTWRAWFTWDCWEGRWKGQSTFSGPQCMIETQCMLQFHYAFHFLSGGPRFTWDIWEKWTSRHERVQREQRSPGHYGNTHTLIFSSYFLKIRNNIRYKFKMMCDISRDLLVWKVDRDLVDHQEP